MCACIQFIYRHKSFKKQKKSKLSEENNEFMRMGKSMPCAIWINDKAQKGKIIHFYRMH